MRRNGGLIGKYNGPSSTFANGVIDLSTHYSAKVNSYWPYSTKQETWLTTKLGLSDNNARLLVPNTQVYGITVGNSDMSLYITSFTAGNAIIQYNMTESSNLQTASIANIQNLISLTNLSTFSPTSVEFSPDGTKMLVMSFTRDNVYSYSLSTAWDLKTATYDNNVYNVSGQEISPHAVEIGNNGFNMYVVGTAMDIIYQYQMNTAYNVATAYYTGRNFGIVTQEGSTYDMDFLPDGSGFCIVGNDNDTIHRYSMNTSWNIATSYYTNSGFKPLQNTSNHTATTTSTPSGFSFNSDGSKFFVTDITTPAIYAFKTRTPYSLNLPVTYVSTSSSALSVTSLETTPRAVAISPDEKTIFMCGSLGDRIFQYTLNTPGNTVSSNTFSGFTHIAPASTGSFLSCGISFKPDGSRVFIFDAASASISEFRCPRAFNVTDAVFVKNVGGGTFIQIEGGVMHPEGTYIYTIRSSGTIFRYQLAEAWNVQTVTANTQYTVGANTGGTGLGATLRGISFSNDGRQMYLSGPANGWLDRYELSTAWDITTAGFVRDTIYLEGIDTVVTGHCWNNKGTKLYFVGDTNDRIYQYNLEPF